MGSKKFKIGQSVSLRKKAIIRQHPDSYLISTIDNDSFAKIISENTQIKFTASSSGYFSDSEELPGGTSGIILGYENVYFLEYYHIKHFDYQNLSSEEKLKCFKFRYSNYYYRSSEKKFYIVLIDGKKVAFTSPAMLESVDDAIDRHKHVDVVFSCMMRIDNANENDVATKIKKRLNSLKTVVDSPHVVSISTVERDGSAGVMSIDDDFNVSYTKQLIETSTENEMQSEACDEKA